jgi:hypothetical protein
VSFIQLEEAIFAADDGADENLLREQASRSIPPLGR